MTAKTTFVPSSVTATTPAQSKPPSPTMAPTTVAKTEAVTTSTTPTIGVPATVITTLGPTTTAVIQTAYPSSTASSTGLMNIVPCTLAKLEIIKFLSRQTLKKPFDKIYFIL